MTMTTGFLERWFHKGASALAHWLSNHPIEFKAYTIQVNEGDYLTRILFPRIFGARIMLHHFHGPDTDPDPHNHPWKWAFSFILTGGYIEERFDRIIPNQSIIRIMRPGRVNKLTYRDFHKVKSLLSPYGCWTLFVAGPRKQNWGFRRVSSGIIVPWKTYLYQHRCAV